MGVTIAASRYVALCRTSDPRRVQRQTPADINTTLPTADTETDADPTRPRSSDAATMTQRGPLGPAACTVVCLGPSGSQRTGQGPAEYIRVEIKGSVGQLDELQTGNGRYTDWPGWPVVE